METRHVAETPGPQGDKVSGVTFEPSEDGFCIAIEAAGWRGPALAAGVVGGILLLTGVGGAMVTLMLSISGMHIGVTLFISFLAALHIFAGAFVLAAARRISRAVGLLDVVGESLLVTVDGWKGTRQRQWTSDEIKSIRVGPSNLSINNEPLMELQITPREGEPEGYLTGRGEETLEWIAGKLREGLKVGGWEGE
ncbi:MAG: hypothetical protein EA376_12770 [Phycisphaeraceae bacterium]|nr:MAG: hypothetical protein EA376_12770 [Phycisphaeraceae bacterium]